MKKYFKILLGIIFVLLISLGSMSTIYAQSFMPPEDIFPLTSNESRNSSYFVDETGSADVWLRIDQINIIGGEYGLELPKGTNSDIKAWYRESNGGCIYPEEITAQGTEPSLPVMERYPCKAEMSNWNELKVKQSGNKITVNIPKLKSLKDQNQRTISLGLTWKMANITNKKWWGREVKVETVKSTNYVSYEQVAVELPPGVYLREKQAVGPVNWNDMMVNKSMMSQPQSGLDIKQQFKPSMFDLVGSGQVIKVKDNIAPGKDYSFILLTSTSKWKLYLKEIGIMITGAIVLILVASLLLRLVVGRKPFGWYVAVMLLVIILVGIIIWMTTAYKSLFLSYPPSMPVDYPATSGIENF